MNYLSEVVSFESGSPQFRITEVIDEKAPLYNFYGQQEIENDLVGLELNRSDSKQIRTYDEVSTLSQGDVVFSLTSGTATIVSGRHQGYLYTQNFVKLVKNEMIDSNYLTYLLNENSFIQKQLQLGLQGSQVLKYTLKQVKDLELPNLPTLKKQSIIGNLYFNQLRLQALKTRVAKLETTIVLEKLREVNK